VKILLVLAVVVSAFWAVNSSTPVVLARPPQNVVLQGVRVVDGTGGMAVANALVVIPQGSPAGR
jgi:hypothetical protein